MPFWKDIDVSDHNVLIGALQELIKLRNLLTDRWVNAERFVGFMDQDHDGNVSYDEFYDGLAQFGLNNDVDVGLIYAYIDTEKAGKVPTSKMLDALKLGSEKDAEGNEESDDDLDLPPFPETLLVGLVAHNNLKASMMKFVKENLSFFKRVSLVTTGSTGRALNGLGLTVDTLVSSGPLGGDQEIGGMIARGEVAAVFFFTDPLSAHPHEPDIQALNRICCVHDTMFANNPSTAQALVYALEYSAFGFSRLTGANPTYQKADSKIVEKYKRDQQKVIARVSRASLRSSVASSVTTPEMGGDNRDSSSPRRASMAIRSGSGLRTSVIHAPPMRSSQT